MYSVIIVDDERNIREGILDLIEWEELGCKVEGTFRNGEQVVKYMQENGADIVITDIKMPIMDGIELAQIIRETHPEVEVVILTAYSDFTFAQKAIKYQVSDFVIKNEFLIDLPRAISRITEKLDKRKKQEVSNGEPKAIMQESKYRVCACEVKANYNSSIKEKKIHLEKILSSTLGENSALFLPNDDNSFFLILEKREGSLNEKDEIEKKLQKFMQLTREFIQMELRIGVSGVIGEESNYGQGKQSALKMLASISNDVEPIVFFVEKQEEQVLWMDDWDVDHYMRSLYVVIRDGTKEEQEEVKEEFLKYIQNVGRPIELCKSDAHAITSYLLRKVRGFEREEEVFDQESLLKAVYLVKSKASLWDVMNNVCDTVSDTLCANVLNQNALVKSVNEIIKKGYKEKLSLKDISQKLFVNSSYLSRVYKKETGVTVTDAINHYRVKRAKEILQKKEYKVYEVGIMVGIEDPAYFTHVFLKYEGETPKDYMNR